MDKAALIRHEIEKRRDHNLAIGNPLFAVMAEEDIELLSFIDSLQEETVSKDLEEASKEWLRPQLDKSYANYGEVKMMELTHFDGYAMLDAIEFGAQWQKEKDSEEKVLIYKHGFDYCKEQMMKDAIDAEVSMRIMPDSKDYVSFDTFHTDLCYNEGDKVKLVVIK